MGTGSATLRIVGLSPNPDKELLPLPIFIHADDVVRRRGFAYSQSALSFYL